MSIEVSDGLGRCPTGFDSVASLLSPTGTLLVRDDNGGVSPCSKIVPTAYPAAANLPVGTYKVTVEGASSGATTPLYVVAIRVTPPGCGDAILEAGEQCDDGNTTSGDGCSATCKAESPWEIEPNGSTITATPLWPTTSSWNGSISRIGDRDYYAFTLPSTASVTLTTHDVGSPSTCGFDTVIHLLNASGVQLVQDDENGVASCSKISPSLYPAAAALPAGTYYVWVQSFSDSTVIPAYSLDLTTL